MKLWYPGISCQGNTSTSFLSWCLALSGLAPGSASGHIWCLKTGFHRGELRTDVTFKGGKSASLPNSAKKNSEHTLQLLSNFLHFYRLMKIMFNIQQVKKLTYNKKLMQIDWTSNLTMFSIFLTWCRKLIYPLINSSINILSYCDNATIGKVLN